MLLVEIWHITRIFRSINVERSTTYGELKDKIRNLPDVRSFLEQYQKNFFKDYGIKFDLIINHKTYNDDFKLSELIDSNFIRVWILPRKGDKILKKKKNGDKLNDSGEMANYYWN